MQKLSERLELRLTLDQKNSLREIAKRERRTMASFMDEWIEILIKDYELKKDRAVL